MVHRPTCIALVAACFISGHGVSFWWHGSGAGVAATVEEQQVLWRGNTSGIDALHDTHLRDWTEFHDMIRADTAEAKQQGRAASPAVGRVQQAGHLVDELAAVTVHLPQGGVDFHSIMQRQSRHRGTGSSMTMEQQWASCIGARGKPPPAFTSVRNECGGSEDDNGSNKPDRDQRCTRAVLACGTDRDCFACLTSAVTQQPPSSGHTSWIRANVPRLQRVARGIPDPTVYNGWCNALDLMISDLAAAANSTLAHTDAVAIAAAASAAPKDGKAAAAPTVMRVHVALEALVRSACDVLTMPVKVGQSTARVSNAVHDGGAGDDVFSALLDLYHAALWFRPPGHHLSGVHGIYGCFERHCSAALAACQADKDGCAAQLADAVEHMHDVDEDLPDPQGLLGGIEECDDKYDCSGLERPDREPELTLWRIRTHEKFAAAGGGASGGASNGAAFRVVSDAPLVTEVACAALVAAATLLEKEHPKSSSTAGRSHVDFHPQAMRAGFTDFILVHEHIEAWDAVREQALAFLQKHSPPHPFPRPVHNDAHGNSNDDSGSDGGGGGGGSGRGDRSSRGNGEVGKESKEEGAEEKVARKIPSSEQHWRVEQMTLSVRRRQRDPQNQGDPLHADDSVFGYDAEGRPRPFWSFGSEEHCCAHRTHAVVVFLNGFSGGDGAAVFSGADLRFVGPATAAGPATADDNEAGEGEGVGAETVVQPQCGRAVAYTTGPENAYRVAPIEGGGAMFAVTLYFTGATLHDADSEIKGGANGHTAISEGSRESEAGDKRALVNRPADEVRVPNDEL